jgi:hypothetical protein
MVLSLAVIKKTWIPVKVVSIIKVRYLEEDKVDKWRTC